MEGLPLRGPELAAHPRDLGAGTLTLGFSLGPPALALVGPGQQQVKAPGAGVPAAGIGPAPMLPRDQPVRRLR